MAKDKQKLFEDQFDDEEVLFVFRKHPVVMRKGLMIGMLGILLPVLFTGILAEVSLRRAWENPPSLTFFFGSIVVGLVLGILLMLPSWVAWHFSLYIVTNQRFIQITQKGFFHRSVVDIGLDQIQMVNYEIAGLQETLLGFGTIMMQTYMGDLVVHEVHKPAHIQKKLLKILRDQDIIATTHPIRRDQDDEENNE